MIDASTKEIVKGLFNEILDLDEEKAGLSKDTQKILKKNQEYLNLLEEKKQLENKIKEKEESLLNELVEQKKTLTTNIKLIKEDISQKLDCKIKIVNQVYKFFKVKFLNNTDELKEVTDNFVEVFEI